MKERIKELGYWCDDKLRSFCGEITPDKRLTVIAIFLLIGTLVNLYFTFSSVYNLGHKDAQKDFIEVEHIKQLELEKSKNYLNEETNEYND